MRSKSLIPRRCPPLIFNQRQRLIATTLNPNSSFPVTAHFASPPPPLKMSSNGFIKGSASDPSLSSSYEAAMQALSSLITRRKRGDGSTRSFKFDLMFKYLEVNPNSQLLNILASNLLLLDPPIYQSTLDILLPLIRFTVHNVEFLLLIEFLTSLALKDRCLNSLPHCNRCWVWRNV